MLIRITLKGQKKTNTQGLIFLFDLTLFFDLSIVGLQHLFQVYSAVIPHSAPNAGNHLPLSTAPGNHTVPDGLCSPHPFPFPSGSHQFDLSF